MMRTPMNSRLQNGRKDGVRSGATLTEVLMSLLIMSVGVISVFSLYPIAVLRSIQATQLTHSKVLLGNAEAEILGDPALINGSPLWRPNTPYRLGDIVVAPSPPGSTLSSSGFRFVCTQAGLSAASSPALTSLDAGNANYGNNGTALGSNPPGAIFEDTDGVGGFSGGDVVWQRAIGDVQTVSGLPHAPVRTLEPIAGSSRLVTVVDPLGWARHHGTSLFGLRDSYGTAARMDGGIRGLVDDGTGALAVAGRSMAFLTGSPLSVEATFRSQFGYRDPPPANSKGFFDWDGATVATGNNEELSTAQLLQVAHRRVQLPDDYESSIEPITNATVITPAAPGLTQIVFPPSPETTAFLDELDSTVAALELIGQSRVARVIFETFDGRAAVSRWISSTTGAGGTGNGIDSATSSIFVAPVEPTDFGAPASTATRPIQLTPVDSTGTATPNGQILINSVRVELNESRYSWLATITRDASGGLVGADCVVFFRRDFEASNEVGFNAQIGNDPTVTTDDPEDGGFSATLAAQNANRAYIYTGRDASAPFDGVTDTLPGVAVGRDLFDSVNGIWYRISAIVTAAGADGITVVELDRAAEVIVRDADQTLVNAPAVGDPQVVIPWGVVKIFPMDLNR